MYFPEDISRAIEKFLSGSFSEEDYRVVNEWYNSFIDEEIFISTDIKDARQRIKERIKMRLQKMLEEDDKHMQEKRKPVRKISWYTVAAAVVIILTGTAVLKYYASSRQPIQVAARQAPVIRDVAAPLSSNPILTLADGSTIALGGTTNGSVALQGNTQIIKLSDGELSYNGADRPTELMYNTLTVPKGSKVVNLKLSDGTQVWLNSESTLKYPVTYINGEQKVYVNGEAYFEVSKNARRKFIVSAGNTTSEVLGTHFNVNAYAENEIVKVTLLEGKLKVANANANRIITPGQQAKLTFGGPVQLDHQVDLEEVMAWKNGLFKFNREDLKSIMRKIERWYNVEVSYEGNTKTLTFGGIIPRKENVSAVLDLLQMTGIVKFSIKPSTTGKSGRIIVKI